MISFVNGEDLVRRRGTHDPGDRELFSIQPGRVACSDIGLVLCRLLETELPSQLTLAQRANRVAASNELMGDERAKIFQIFSCW